MVKASLNFQFDFYVTVMTSQMLIHFGTTKQKSVRNICLSHIKYYSSARTKSAVTYLISCKTMDCKTRRLKETIWLNVIDHQLCDSCLADPHFWYTKCPSHQGIRRKHANCKSQRIRVTGAGICESCLNSQSTTQNSHLFPHCHGNTRASDYRLNCQQVCDLKSSLPRDKWII